MISEKKGHCRLYYCSAKRTNQCCAYCTLRELCDDGCGNQPQKCGQLMYVVTGYTERRHPKKAD